MRKEAGIRNPYDAYFRLRRAYTKNNQSWFGDEPVIQEVEPVPSVVSQRANAYGEYQPQNYSSIDDVVEAETRKLFRS